jgi:hypothetical protein
MQLTRLLGSAENRGSGCYRSPAIHGRLREPVNELNARFGTRDDNPRLPLHLLNSGSAQQGHFDPYRADVIDRRYTPGELRSVISEAEDRLVLSGIDLSADGDPIRVEEVMTAHRRPDDDRLDQRLDNRSALGDGQRRPCAPRPAASSQ